jgi:hypothetical protein
MGTKIYHIAWHILFLSLWKDFESRFKGILNSLRKQRDFLDAEAVSFDIVEAQNWRIKMEEWIKRREAEAKIAQLSHSIAWLAVDDSVQETLLELRSDRQYRGTCEWVAKVPQMISWNTDDCNEPTLWLKGIPGAGKPYN